MISQSITEYKFSDIQSEPSFEHSSHLPFQRRTQ